MEAGTRRYHDAMVVGLDRALGRTTAALRGTHTRDRRRHLRKPSLPRWRVRCVDRAARGMYNATLLVFASDNGGRLADSITNYPMAGGKYSNLQGGVVPPQTLEACSLATARLTAQRWSPCGGSACARPSAVARSPVSSVGRRASRSCTSPTGCLRSVSARTGSDPARAHRCCCVVACLGPVQLMVWCLGVRVWWPQRSAALALTRRCVACWSRQSFVRALRRWEAHMQDLFVQRWHYANLFLQYENLEGSALRELAEYAQDARAEAAKDAGL